MSDQQVESVCETAVWIAFWICVAYVITHIK